MLLYQICSLLARLTDSCWSILLCSIG
jgi:hypothetical protein